MDIPLSQISIYLLFVVQSLFAGSTLFFDYPVRVTSYAKHLWMYLFFITVAIKFSISAASIFLAIICFLALREYYSLIAIQKGDRLAILGSFLAIPLMLLTLVINTPWIFIALGPLYAFFLIPFLVSVGSDDPNGVLFSATIIDFGLFLFVYGNGLFGFLVLNNIWLAVIVLINVSLSDAIAFLLYSMQKRQFSGKINQYLVSIPFTVTSTLLVSDWTSLNIAQSLFIGSIVPVFIAVIRYTMFYIESDLGTAQEYNSLRRGRLINSSCSLVLTSPVILYFLLFLME